MCVLLIIPLLWVVGRLGPRKPVNHTSWVAVVTPTVRPKLVRNRCVIKLYGGVFVLSTCPFDKGFCHMTGSDLFLFLHEVARTFDSRT